MKLSKFLLLITFATLFCFFYVYQQTEIFRLAYTGQKKSAAFQEYLDKNTILRYNIKKITSLTRIEDKVSGYANFEMPQNYRLVRATNSEEIFRVVKQPQSLKQKNIVWRLFGIKREAQAKTINPANTPPSKN